MHSEMPKLLERDGGLHQSAIKLLELLVSKQKSSFWGRRAQGGGDGAGGWPGQGRAVGDGVRRGIRANGQFLTNW